MSACGKPQLRSVFFRLPSPARAVRVGLLLVLACGCSASSRAPARAAAPGPTAAATATEPSPPASRPALQAQSWGAVTSLRFSLVVKLPEHRAWQVDDHTSHWLLLRHPASDSELRVRTWRAARLVRPDDCERQARLWRPEIPTPTADTALDQRQLASPAGYTTRVVAGVQPSRQSGTLEGFVLAFGADVGRCFAFVYTTRASGPGAEASIGDRLALIDNGVLPAVRMRSIDDRVH